MNQMKDIKMLSCFIVISLVVHLSVISSWANNIPMQTVTYYFESDYTDFLQGPYTRPAEYNEIYQDLGLDPYFDGYINGTDIFVETASTAWYTGEFGNDVPSAYYLADATGMSDLFSGLTGLNISFDYDFSINSINSASYALAEFTLTDVSGSQIVDNVQINSNDGYTSGTYTYGLGALNPSHTYFYELKSVAYSYYDINDQKNCSSEPYDAWCSDVLNTVTINNITPVLVPEPISAVLFIAGGAALAWKRYSGRKRT